MKINVNNIADHVQDRYMKMPFPTLFEMVFDTGGDLKECPRKAVRSLIIRLEQHYQMSGFGSVKLCRINEMDAYLAGILIIRHGRDA